jgi:hypothetical protein
MSDFNFYHNPTSSITVTAVFNKDIFTLTTATTFSTGDVIYMPVSDTTGLYGYCIDGAAKEFRYDTGIYGIFTGTDVVTGCKYWDKTDDLLYNDVTNYRIAAEVENGLYSHSYIKYSSSVDYTLIVVSKRREFFSATENKSTKELILADNVVFSDACKEVAYGVGFAGNDFETFNNRFKSSLEFNIATR